METPERLINVDLTKMEAIKTSHGSGMKKVISAGFDIATIIKQIAQGILMPGDVIPVHTHPDMDECYFFISGNGFMYIDEDAIPVGPEHVVNVPAGAAHRLVCTNEPLRFFYISLELVNK